MTEVEVYLDNSATTRAFDEVADVVTKEMIEDYGNPSSMHHRGVMAENKVREAAEAIANTLKADPREILFTSGGTESDNTALIGVAKANQRRGKHIITTSIEHPAIFRTCEQLEKEGFEITYLPVDHEGRISLTDLENALRPDTILVSIMAVNNEIGTIEPIYEAGALIKQKVPNCYFHVDAVQGYCKVNIIPKKANVDLMSVSGHKIHGPKGVGFLYIKQGTKILPVVYGGGQQKGMRSGTQNVPGIVGLATAAAKCHENFDEEINKLYELKEYFINTLSSKLDEISFNGPRDREKGAPHIISLSVSGVRSEVMLHALEDKGIYVSAGSACASNDHHTSDTLREIGIREDLMDSTIRISLSVFTKKEELDYCIDQLCSIVPMLRRYSRR